MDTPVYLDPSFPFEARAADLVSRMTLEEKISQLNSNAPAVPRLGVPAYAYWSEGLHGMARNGRATVFPQAIGMAATWDPELIQRIGSAIGDEARAKHHEALRRNGFTQGAQGLTIWSPNVNQFRDPRWGRGQETWGEDPTLTGEMGAAFVRGLQGNDPKYLKTAACAKHFAVHSGPEKERHSFDARVTRRELHDTYLPAFKKLVTEAKVESVMSAYNRVNGEPCSVSRFLLDEILRQRWGFRGHVVSDAWAMDDVHGGHGVAKDEVETAAMAMNAGLDLSTGPTYNRLGEALERGLITEEQIDQALERVLMTRFKLGMFDPDEMVPFAATPMSVVGCDLHRALAYEAAQKSMVLLKNSGVLPISKNVHSMAVVGPAAANLDVLLGNYYGISDTMTSVIEGIAGRAPEGMRVEYRLGCTWDEPGRSKMNWAVNLASECDLTIACMGLSLALEGEEGESILSDDNGDRVDIRLPRNQVKFLQDLKQNGAKVILVLFGGSPLAIGEVEDLVEAVLFAWYPGQEGGRAAADLLFGDFPPSGKLPLTFPKSVDQLPPFDNYHMDGRTYRYAEWEPLYPFGFGLSYTRFEYSDLKLDSTRVPLRDPLRAAVTVTNAGPCAAEEVVQAYLTDLETSVEAPCQKLVAFQRVSLDPGESRAVQLVITPESMMLVDDEGRQRLEPGRFRLTVGGCSPGVRGMELGAPEGVSAEFEVV